LEFRKANTMLRIMPASIYPESIMGAKISALSLEKWERELVRNTLILYDIIEGKLIAIMGAYWLSQVRTAASTGVATKFLANSDANVLGVLGSGRFAEMQILAISAVRTLNQIKVYSRNEAKRIRFCETIRSNTNLEIVSVNTPKEVVRGSDILVTITDSADPVFEGKWVELGTHINAVGSNNPTHRELDSDLVVRSKVIVDSREQALKEAGDLIIPIQEGVFDVDNIYAELGQVVAGVKLGRCNASEITLFKSCGIAIEDIVVAGVVYDLAKKNNFGTEIDFGPVDATSVT
ncbi:MAG TPA: ornithine cyclodeaminase family protein, partial [Nitrososphaerales archaeon]|nr:ornithine cyclodeaminase family protein [Nitrososphaerales archaeon]